MKYLAAITVSLVALPIFLIAIRHSVRKWESKHREPFARRLLRPPGHNCQQRWQEANDDALYLLGANVGMVLPLILGLILLDLDLWTIFGTLIVYLVFSLISARRIHAHLNRARIEKMGYLGELAVAEALSELPTSEGWRIFHDIRLKGENGKEFNIDHVAVGPNGIFAIESKAWSKYREKVNREDDLIVTEDRVEFPLLGGTKRYKTPLKQARGAAANLSHWLEGITGHRDFVHAQVVTPGWKLYYRGKQNKQICESNCVAAFLRQTPGELPESRRSQIIAALDDHCRDLGFERADNFLSHYAHHQPPASEPITCRPRDQKAKV